MIPLVHGRWVMMRLIPYMMRQITDGNLHSIVWLSPRLRLDVIFSFWVVLSLWCNPFRDNAIDALWFLIRITRTDFFLPEKKGRETAAQVRTQFPLSGIINVFKKRPIEEVWPSSNKFIHHLLFCSSEREHWQPPLTGLAQLEYFN